MSVIATCGHDITDDKGIFVGIKDHDREGNRVVSFPVLCKECYRMYVENDLVLPTEQDQEDWLNGKLVYLKDDI